MKKYIAYFFAFIGTVVLMDSCYKESLSPESVIKDSRIEKTAFDYWLDANFLRPYNIDFKYRYELKETNLSYWTVPADVNNSIIYAHLVKYLCVDTYDEVAGVDFTRAYFPKMFFLEGEFHYDNNGTMILGTAEGGRKIFLAGVNHLDYVVDQAMQNQTLESLNELYIKTIHHEFTHILNQTKDFPVDFQDVTGTGYVLDSWSRTPNWLKNGFITDYSQHSPREDFAEMMSTYIINTPEWWAAQMATAGTASAALIAQKLEIVKNYMRDSWSIDLDELRTVVNRRSQDLLNGRVNLTDITL